MADIPRPVLITAYAVGGAAVGVVFEWGVQLFPPLDPVGWPSAVWAAALTPVITVLAGLAAPRIPAPPWAVAALGAALYGGLQQVDSWVFGDRTIWLVVVAAAVGLALGGAVLALDAETGLSRVAIAAGMAGGVLMPIVFERALGPGGGPGSTLEWAATMAYGMAFVLVMVAALQGVAVRVPVQSAVGIAAVAVALVTVQCVASRVVEASPPRFGLGSVSIAPRATVAEVAGPLLAAVLLGSGLAWLTYRRSGVDALRWVVVGCAVAVPLAVGRGAIYAQPVLVPLAALAGVVIGVAFGRPARRGGFGDVVGPLVCAAGLVADVRAYQLGIGAEARFWLPAALLLAGVGVTLGSGLTRLARRTGTATDGGGTALLDGALPGFAAIIVIGSVLVPLAWKADDVRPLDLGPALIEVLCAVVPVVLYVLARRARSETARESSIG